MVSKVFLEQRRHEILLTFSAKCLTNVDDVLEDMLTRFLPSETESSDLFMEEELCESLQKKGRYS